MGRLLVGSLVAAAAMFVIGFLFYGTPMFSAAYRTAPLETQMTVQEALKALPASGTYFIPMGEDEAAMAAHRAGPTAMIRVSLQGSEMMDPMVMVKGFIHMAVSAFLLGLLLYRVAPKIWDFGGRMAVVVLASLAVVVFARLGEPIWFGADWPFTLYVAVTDVISLVVAGFILAKWFLPRSHPAS
nr:B293 [uncultured bacterium]